MPQLIGGLMALVALAAGTLGGVEPVSCIMRAGIAYLTGVVATQLWYVFFTIRVVRDRDEPLQLEATAPMEGER
jgi:hypothetical protein